MKLAVKNMMNVRIAGVALVAAAGLAATASLAFAQPERDGPPGSSMREGQPPMGERGPGRGPEKDDVRGEAGRNPEVLKKLLRAKVDEARSFADWGEEAIKRLNDGAPPFEIWQESQRWAQELRRLQPGGARREMGREMDGMRDREGPGMRGGRLGDGPDGERGGPQGEKGEKGERRDGQQRRLGPMTEEDRASVMGFMREHLPLIAERIEATRKTDPDMAEKMFGRVAPKVRDAMEVKERNPKLFELRTREIKAGVAVVDALREVREALVANDDAKKSGADASLRKALEDQYDVRTSLRQHEIEDLKSRLERMQAEVNERASKKAAAIDELMNRTKTDATRGIDRDDTPLGAGGPPGKP